MSVEIIKGKVLRKCRVVVDKEEAEKRKKASVMCDGVMI